MPNSLSHRCVEHSEPDVLRTCPCGCHRSRSYRIGRARPELRHSFVSLLSDDGVPLENIARLVGHRTTTVTETVYRQQLRPVIEDAATAMNRIFPARDA